jgi:competence protein ComEC
MRFWKYTYFILLLVLSLIIIALFQLPDANLHIIACDVGQGDAILITYKNIQILTDGGPDNKVLNCLGRYIPFYDRQIEMVILTHPDADHSTGLIEVIKRYKVNKILINSIDSGTPVYGLLQKVVKERGVGVVNPVSSLSIGISLIHLDILNPTDELFNRLTVIDESSKTGKYLVIKEANLYSIVYKFSFKKFSGLFLGDIPPAISDSLAVQRLSGSINYIKVPHHGSSNGLTQNLLEKIKGFGGFGTVGVISVGKDNLWGFPAPEIIKMLSDKDIKILRTDQMGDASYVTDGEKWWIKK